MDKIGQVGTMFVYKMAQSSRIRQGLEDTGLN